tara:strand:+ start:250 stop:1080 length:831 start_codon:yes stop_codon:yes gene_type:complete
MNILAIFVIIVLVLVIIWALNNLIFKTNIIYDIMCDAKQKATASSSNVINNEDLNENNTSNFMLSVWFYIDSWGNEIGNEKNILYLATNIDAQTVSELQGNLSGLSTKVKKENMNTEIYKNLNICLDKFENNLFVDVETYPDSSTISDTQSTFTRYKISNIPVQKWNCLTLCIDTRTMDIYLDGKLVNSFILHGLYKNVYENYAKKNMYLGSIGNNNGFEGFITRIRYDPYALNPEEVYKIYKEGIDQSLARSLFNKYKLKVSFLEYNKSIGELSI